jgi:hypothetical protein
MNDFPPPWSFENTNYSSEWKEWSSSLPPDVDVLDLKWFHLDKRMLPNEQEGRGLLYLLGCTSTGEIIVWSNVENEVAARRVEHEMMEDRKDPNGTRGAPLQPTPVMRFQLSTGALHKMQILVTTATDSVSLRIAKNMVLQEHQSAKSSDSPAFTLFVAGAKGLWYLPLYRLLFSHEDFLQAASSDVLTVLRDGPILDIQLQQHGCLYVLKSKSLVVIDLATLYKPVLHLPLSPFLKNQQNRRWQRQKTKQELCTTIHVSKIDKGNAKTLVLVGTNQSRIILLTIEGNADASTTFSLAEKPRILLLESTPPRGFGESPAVSSPSNCEALGGLSWSVTKIMEMHGTWWMVAAKANHDNHSTPTNHHGSIVQQVNNGLLTTFYVPIETAVASCQTREAIHDIVSNCSTTTSIETQEQNDALEFYTVGNNRVVSIWKSPYQLERSGRLWVSPTSTKTIAAITCNCTNENETGSDRPAIWTAMAGIGNCVDLFVDNCRIRTLTI